VGFWSGANAIIPEPELDLTAAVCGGVDHCPLEQFLAKANEYPDISKQVGVHFSIFFHFFHFLKLFISKFIFLNKLLFF
jgi:hypothetical protein